MELIWGGGKTDKMPTQAELSLCLNAGGMGRQDYETETLVVAGGFFDQSQPLPFDTTQVTSKANRSNPKHGDECHPLTAHGNPPSIAFPANLSATQHASSCELSPAIGSKNPVAVAGFLPSQGSKAQGIGYEVECGPTLRRGAQVGAQVRRLTPLECERLQAFPDHYTAIQYRNKPAADGPRYRAIGNSMATNVMRWIGQRIQIVEEIK